MLFLRPSGTSCADLARATGLSEKLLTAFIDGDVHVNEYLAFRLADHFGTTAAYWIGLQRRWEHR
ncbi:hypothetical protein C1Y63_06965 [Corynebacterium sp. 13CS0277]|nr:hypothetical protein C1Y63_06965 [Corynebacterium sp. 13CS0277]